jgi:hypothetical protein
VLSYLGEKLQVFENNIPRIYCQYKDFFEIMVAYTLVQGVLLTVYKCKIKEPHKRRPRPDRDLHRGLEAEEMCGLGHFKHCDCGLESRIGYITAIFIVMRAEINLRASYYQHSRNNNFALEIDRSDLLVSNTRVEMLSFYQVM